MNMIFHREPAGWPGLVAFGLGGLIFIASVLLARRRADPADRGATRGRANITWAGIVVQGIGITFAALGPIHIVSGTPTGVMLLRAVIVFALMVGAVGLFNAASRTMGKNWSLVARTRSDHVLVQTGPFAHVRHPIYVAMFLFMCAMAIAYGHINALIIAIPVFALGTWLRISHEERLLRDMFGSKYDAYAARVKRFVPGIF